MIARWPESQRTWPGEDLGHFRQCGCDGGDIRATCRSSALRVLLGAPVENLPAPRNFVDEHVFANLKEIGIPPRHPVVIRSFFVESHWISPAGCQPKMKPPRIWLVRKPTSAIVCRHVAAKPGLRRLLRQQMDGTAQESSRRTLSILWATSPSMPGPRQFCSPN